MFCQYSTVKEAHYTNGSTRKPATVSIAVRFNSDRRFTHEIPVTGKREARKVAAQHNAICWNF